MIYLLYRMLNFVDTIIMALIGLFAGTMIGLSGASGAAIMVSLLYLAVGFSIHESIGITLLANAIASLSVFLVYYRNKNVDFSPCIWLAAGSIPGSQAGAFVGKLTPETQLGGILGITMILIGILLWKKGMEREKLIRKLSKMLRIRNPITKKLLSVVVGVWVGIMSGLFGASGGMWFLIVLLLFGLPLHKSIGGAVFLMSITAGCATVAHYMYGNVNVIAGIIVGLGAMISGNISARFANRSTEKRLMKVIALVISILGILIILTKFVIPRL